MIGWYVHHQGQGHLHRAAAVIPHLGIPVTVLSSLPRPSDWTLPWVSLDRDDDAPASLPSAGGHLHWAPLGHTGLRSRMGSLSAWFVNAEPSLMVSDVSVEVALIARLHGVPVVSVALPGDRSDSAHQLGYGISTELIGCWPPDAAGVVQGLATRDAERLRMVGSLSRFPVARNQVRRPGAPRVTVLMGAGGSGLTAAQLDRARSETQGWEWSVLGGEIGDWHDNVFERLCDADVVVSHAGQNALAEVAAARRPAVVIPERRPHGEQVASARVLRDGAWPVLVHTRWPEGRWASLLERARRLDGQDWATWCDDLAPTRFADVLRSAMATEPIGVA